MNHGELINQLKALKMATDDAIGKIEEVGCDGSINWADLSCVQAMQITTDEGTEYLEVLIEEASPDVSNNEFREMIRQGLNAAGWPGVMVRTEW